MKSYVFILCPQYSGSTVLWQLLATSDQVSVLPMEGQFLPEVRGLMRDNPWGIQRTLPWPMIRGVWDRYWDQGKPVLVEKSPPNLAHAHDIAKVFEPATFLIMVRNPYAHCEGLMRRAGWQLQNAAEFTVRCMRRQAENAESLPSSIRFTYEELVEHPGATCRRIQSLLPQLGGLKPNQEFSVHSIDGVVARGLTNLNEKKLRNLSRHDVFRIGAVLGENLDIMRYWGYEVYEPPLRHNLAHLLTKSQLLSARALTRGRNLAGRITRGLGWRPS